MTWGWNQALATLVGVDTLTSKPTMIIVKMYTGGKSYYHSLSVACRHLDKLDQS